MAISRPQASHTPARQYRLSKDVDRSQVGAITSTRGGPPADETRPERRAIRGCRVQSSRKRLENEEIAEEAAGGTSAGRQGGLEHHRKGAMDVSWLADEDGEG